METFETEIFDCAEFTLDATVPLYWNDLDAWDDEELRAETTTVKCRFRNPYLKLDVGTAGIDAADPVASFKTTDVPGAAGGDEITIAGITYQVGTPKPDGTGITEVDLIRRV